MENSLTVLICVHSNNNYHDSLLLEALDSLESQTYKDFETLLVFDECWEHTKNKVDAKEYRFNYRSLNREKKQGLAFAKNFGIEQIDTKWICFLDADDLYLPEKLQKQINFVENNDVDFLGTLCWCIHGSDKDNIVPSCFRENQYVTHEDIKRVIFGENVLVHGSMMIKKSCLIELNGYNHRAGWEDWDLWQRAITHGFRFYQLQERLYIHRLGTSVPR